ncbi:MAG TPA: sodium/solute symporter [Sedimentisphaerales bacterium]|nr:sodium/solute symporter [Sedimentisphaerales bacterium]
MGDLSTFSLDFWDYFAFLGYFALLCLVGWWVGRVKKVKSEDYFLAGRTLPWYVVGASFIASNISTEHFIGMIGAAFVYGICVSMSEWANVMSFSVLIWFFIPFLLAAKVFTTPEFMEKRFNSTLRQFFAIVSILCNIVAFLAAVLYGGGIALQKLFGWNMWFAIIVLGIAAGGWALYGGLKSAAWIDLVTVIVMVAGGLMVTVLGIYMLAGENGGFIDGIKVMIQCNQAKTGVWKEVVEQNAYNIAKVSEYNRLSVIQPMTHEVVPWPCLIFGFLSVSIWYNVINQFMIQRVLGAKNAYHARMGIVFAGYLKILLPAIVVMPGLILFAKYPEVMKLEWNAIRPEADKGYVHMLQTLLPIGLRGVFLAALFGAIQSTVQAVLNSTATLFTFDIYKRMLNKTASEKNLVLTGRVTTLVVLIIAIVLGRYIEKFGDGLFVYIQSLYAFFAPPFAAVFLWGVLFKRINGVGATCAVFAGFLFGILMKVYVQVVPEHMVWLEPYSNQSIINWAFCSIVCIGVSLMTAPPKPEQVNDDLTVNWHKINILEGLGDRWYNSVVLWWSIFAIIIVGLTVLLSGKFV